MRVSFVLNADQAIDGWWFNPRFEIRLVFKEAGNDE